MNRYIVGALSLSTCVLFGCFTGDEEPEKSPAPAVESIFTDLRGTSCKDFIDENDPNDTPYKMCPGVSGYSLIVRRVGSGRKSIDVVTPGQERHPLDYQEFITRHMFQLQDKIEWRVLNRSETSTPIALIVGVQAHEDEAEPEQVTRTYMALAKITTDEICVTDKIDADSLSHAEVRQTADSTPEKVCLEPLPHITVDGVIIR